MSPHKKPRTYPAGSAEDLGAAAATVHSWSSTRRILKAYDTAIEFSENDHIDPARFFKLLEELDITDSLPVRLDRRRIAAIPTAYRSLFIRRYISACITQTADQLGWLDPLRASAIVSLPGPGTQAGQSAPARKSSGADNGPYTFLDPATAPFEDRIPRFHGTFLGVLQGRLERILAGKGLLQASHIDEHEMDLLKTLASNKLPDERLFGECRSAAAGYFRHVLGGSEMIASTVLSRISGPFMFLWLRSSGLLGDMIAGLLRGKPMMHPRNSDPSGKTIYEPTEFGAETGLW